MRHVFRPALVGLAAAALLSVGNRGAIAQEAVADNGRPAEQNQPGWTLIPTVGLGEMYDDNISLFSAVNAATVQDNGDYVSNVFPAASLRYAGKHSDFDTGYHGSLLAYRTFSALNRWDQGGFLTLKRQESVRLKWEADASLAAVPSTDFIDLGGIPYRHVGTLEGLGGGSLSYRLSRTSTISGGYRYQSVSFDRSQADTSSPLVLRGGHVQQGDASVRHAFTGRLALGVDYTFRHSSVLGDVEHFNIHLAQAAIDYDLSRLWIVHGGAGVVHLQSTAFTAARSGPSWLLGVERHGQRSTVHLKYQRSYVPSLGFGGTVSSQEFGGGLFLILPGTRRFYTSHSVSLRDNQPLTRIDQQLPLRSWRSTSILGWEARPWVRLEAFYSHTRQDTHLVGGILNRNRIGFQIVTSKPVRLQ